MKTINSILKNSQPFSRALLKTFTSFRFIPRPVLMVTASVASFLWPLLIEPFACALPKKLKMSQQQSSTNSHQTNDWRAAASSPNRRWRNLFSSTMLICFSFQQQKCPFFGNCRGFRDPFGDLAKDWLILQRWSTWRWNNILRLKYLWKINYLSDQ